MARADIVTTIETLVATPQVTVSDKTLVTLKIYKEHPKLDYADCLLSILSGKDGVLTFDKDLQKELLQ